MNKFKLNTLALALTLSTNAMAVQNGEAVTSDEYEEMNYIVNILNSSNELCGAQIIAGKWLLTARHCTDSWDNDDSGSAYDDEAVDGDTMTITVYQGVGGKNGYSDGNSRIVYSGDATLYTFGNSDEVEEVLEEDLDESGIISTLEEGTYYNDTETSTDLVRVSSSIADSIGADLALIKLTDDIPYKHTLKLGLATDLDELASSVPVDVDNLQDWIDTQTVYSDESTTFYGFGLDEDDEKVYTMQKASLEVTSAPLSATCKYFIHYEGADTENVDCEDFILSDYTSDDDYDYVYAKVSTTFRSSIRTEADVTNDGDSGTAFIVDGTAYGLVHGSSILNGGYSSFQSFVGLSEWMMEIVDDLNAPDEIEYLTTDSVESVSIDVQNFSTEEKTLDIAILESSSDVTLDSSDCPETLDSMDSCTVTVTFDSEQDDFTVQLSDTKSTSVSFVDTYTGTYSDDSDDSDDAVEASVDSSSSSGGSTSLFSLVGMCLIAFTRRYTKR